MTPVGRASCSRPSRTPASQSQRQGDRPPGTVRVRAGSPHDRSYFVDGVRLDGVQLDPRGPGERGTVTRDVASPVRLAQSSADRAVDLVRAARTAAIGDDRAVVPFEVLGFDRPLPGRARREPRRCRQRSRRCCSGGRGSTSFLRPRSTVPGSGLIPTIDAVTEWLNLNSCGITAREWVSHMITGLAATKHHTCARLPVALPCATPCRGRCPAPTGQPSTNGRGPAVIRRGRACRSANRRRPARTVPLLRIRSADRPRPRS